MRRRAGFGVTLALYAAAEAAEPTASTAKVATETPAAVPVIPPAAVPVAPPVIVPERAALAPEKPAATKPLDLRIGNVRSYMMPREYLEALDAPDADKATVVVEGKRELLPMDYEKPIPVWPLGPLWWGLRHPTESWRILLPDINRPEDGPPDVVPPPEFRWGP